MQGLRLLRVSLVLWLTQCSLHGGPNFASGLGITRAKAAGAGLPLGALGTRGLGLKAGKTVGRYPGALLGMGAYRGVLGRPVRPGYGALGGYGGYGYGVNGYGYRGPLGAYGGLGTYPGAALGLGPAGYGIGAAAYPGAGLINGYGAGYGNGYGMGADGYGAGLGLPSVLADGPGLAAKAGKTAGALTAGLGLDTVANRYGDGAYLGAGVPPAGAKRDKVELSELLDDGLRG